MLTYDRAVRATRGARDYQEDTALVWPDGEAEARYAAADGRLFAVLADGMGGHVGGALASRLVCEQFVGAVAVFEGDVVDGLMEGLTVANDALAAQVDNNPMLSGMGSTVVATDFSNAGLSWVSVGDSPLYLWRAGEIVMLNEDHSLAPDLDRLAAAGKITVAQAKRDPRRHMLRSAVTGETIELIDLPQNPLKLEPGDYVILASDGVQTLELSEIGRLVTAFADDGASAVAAALIREVDGMRDPHQDNATVVVVRLLAADGTAAPTAASAEDQGSTV